VSGGERFALEILTILNVYRGVSGCWVLMGEVAERVRLMWFGVIGVIARELGGRGDW
jgi:hypothetical protein